VFDSVDARPLAQAWRYLLVSLVSLVANASGEVFLVASGSITWPRGRSSAPRSASAGTCRCSNSLYFADGKRVHGRRELQDFATVVCQ